MSKFKVGDRIVRVHNPLYGYGEMFKGRTYEVSEVSTKSTMIKLKDVSNEYDSRKFELESIYNSPLNQALK